MTSETIVDVIERRASCMGDTIACTFLPSGDDAEEHLTYGELRERARAVGAFLAERGLSGLPVVLMAQSSLTFATGFLGCLYAGALVVPVSPPRSRRNQKHIESLLSRVAPQLCLVDEEFKARLTSELSLSSIGIEEAAEHSATSSKLERADATGIAYIQFTSGSTRQPRGVPIRHDQLMHNSTAIAQAMSLSQDDVGVSWLPLFHDMGLVGTLLTPLAIGARAVHMTPWHFLQRPARWLQSISRYRGTTSGAPNFAYDLCVDRIPAEQRETLELESWCVAFTGSEPIKAQTIARFCAAFEAQGFRREAFYPCYGLAESTLLVTGGAPDEAPVIRSFDKRDLSGNIAREQDDRDSAGNAWPLVGCGRPAGGQEVLIVDPETLLCRDTGEIGEIWVRGGSVADEYWRDEGAAETFQARLADGKGPFLRTGDLGVFYREQLFVTGRLKDIVIVRGKNHYTHDLEFAASESHTDLQSQRCAVVTLRCDGRDVITVVQEVPPRFRTELSDELAEAIRRALSTEFGFCVDRLMLVRFGSIPRTTSGKVRREETRALVEEGALRIVREFNFSGSAQGPGSESAEFTSSVYVRDWLQKRIGQRIGKSADSVNSDRSFAEFGLSSVDIAELTGELELSIGKEIPLSSVFSYPTIDALAAHLAESDLESGRSASAIPETHAEPIAIIGIGCRFPGAVGPRAYWTLLRDGEDAVTELSDRRWVSRHATTVKSGEETDRGWSECGGFINDVFDFDSKFFDLSSAEADSMDPQQRLLMEVTWEALEDAGLSQNSVAGTRTGVFVGISTNDYARDPANLRSANAAFWSTGNAVSIAANRLSYHYDLHGPSMAIDTACSSSLVAVHLAANSLKSGESTLAIAGGVNLMLSPDITANFARIGILSPTRRCRSFDADADGIVRGEGVGIVVLKRMSQAVADGDRIYAAIAGTAMNQDGRSNGLTAPRPSAQSTVVKAACAQAGVLPQHLQYVECHGTGTTLGDPIELEALGSAVVGGERRSRCLVGSVKTNVGHLEAAAGVAGLIKVALSIHRGEIPATLHFRKLNPHVGSVGVPLQVVAELTPWPDVEVRRLAGVSAFGFGVVNAHVICESVPERRAAQISPRRSHYAAVFSAPNERALKAVAGAHREFLSTQQEADLEDIAFSLGARRTHHPYRLSVICNSQKDLVSKLGLFLEGNARRHVRLSERTAPLCSGLVFVFSGQDTAVSPSLFAHLMNEPAYEARLLECDDVIREISDWSLVESVAGEVDSASVGQAEAQMKHVAHQIALSALWESWGVRPSGVVGHSVGEVAAACVSGAISLRDSLTIVRERARVLQDILDASVGGGHMLAIRLPASELQGYLDCCEGEVEIAAYNGPLMTICSGNQVGVTALMRALQRNDVPNRLLGVAGPGHSIYVEPALPELERLLDAVRAKDVDVDFYSTVAGHACNGNRLSASYWAKHLRRPVDFTGAVNAAIADGRRLFLELGGVEALSPQVAACLLHAGERGLAVPSFRERQPPAQSLMDALGALHVAGCSCDWSTVYGNGRLVDLPLYPWQRRRHRLVEETVRAAPSDEVYHAEVANEPGRHSPTDSFSLLGKRLGLASESVVCWESRFDPTSLSLMSDHKVLGSLLMPGAAYVSMARSAAIAIGMRSIVLKDVEFKKAIFQRGSSNIRLQSFAKRDSPGHWRFEVFAAEPGGAAEQAADWRLVASCRFRERRCNLDVSEPLRAIAARDAASSQPLDVREFYNEFLKRGIDYQALFRRVTGLWRTAEGAIIARLRGMGGRDGADQQIVAAVIDACLQPLAAALMTTEGRAPEQLSARSHLPLRISRVELASDLNGELWGFISPHSTANGVASSSSLRGDVTIVSADGGHVATFDGFAVGDVSLANRGRCRDVLEIEWVRIGNPVLAVGEPPTPRLQTDMPGNDDVLWVFLADPDGMGGELAQLVRERGERVVVIPSAAEEDSMVAALQPGCRVVDLRSMENHFDAGDPASKLADQLTQSGVGLANALRELEDAGVSQARLWTVTRGAVCIERGDQIALAQHPIWALARTAAIEHKRRWGGVIDLDPHGTSVQLADELIASVNGSDVESQLAWRGGRRFAPRLSTRSLFEDDQLEFSARRNGTYLITGGLGELGLLAASWLVSRGARRIVLLGRSELPSREKWEAFAGAPSVMRRIAAVRELEAAGATVHIEQVDVSDTGALAQYLEKFAREQWPPIRGVLHLAGHAAGIPLSSLDSKGLFEHVAPKAVGAWALNECFRGKDLDFFVMFSSGSALLGSPGLGAYAVANAFQDALAIHNSQRNSHRTLSVNWGLWSDVGMAVRQSRDGGRAKMPRGMKGISNVDGLRVLGQLVSRGEINVGVMPYDWREWASAHPDTASSPYFSRLVVDETREAHTGQDLRGADLRGRPLSAQTALLRGYLQECMGQVLQVSPAEIPADKPLSELGVDSLMSVELVSRIENSLDVTFPLVSLIQGPTIDDLVNELVGLVDASPVVDDSIDQSLRARTPDRSPAELLGELQELGEDSVDQLLDRFRD